MHSLTDILVRIPPQWRIGLISCAIGLAALFSRLRTEGARAKSVDRKKKRELRLLADKIFVYGNSVHQRYPTGNVIVSEQDLAEQLRKRPDAVRIALNLLLNERKVERAPLNGYWRLNA